MKPAALLVATGTVKFAYFCGAMILTGFLVSIGFCLGHRFVRWYNKPELDTAYT
jgi:hypothetical protein